MLRAEPGERAWTKLGFIFLGCRDYRVFLRGVVILVLWPKIEAKIFFFSIFDFLKEQNSFRLTAKLRKYRHFPYTICPLPYT